jgi:putative aldouronate transport system permease protein
MTHKLKGKKVRINGDALFMLIVYLIMFFTLIITLYPVYFVLIASISDPVYANSGYLLLYPKGIHFAGYTGLLRLKDLWTGYMNTIIYALFGTLFGLCCCLPAGYGLSRSDLPGRNVIMMIMVFTMFFSGGMIPTYLTVQKLGLLNTRLVLIMLGSVSVYNIILIRTFFSSTLPRELLEASIIDGCGNFQFFLRIALPLSKAIIAVIALYIAVYQWNAYFNALLYITDRSKTPLQVIIRELLYSQTIDRGGGLLDQDDSEMQKMVLIIRYSVIVASTLPVMCFYPFVQKYFVKGVMIGSLKG